MKRTMKRNLLAASAALLVGAITNISAADRSYTGGRYLLQLEGGSAGSIQSVEGGDVKGDVVTTALGADHIQKKHIANVKYGEFTMNIGPSLGKDVYDWISAAVDGAGRRKNGAIIAADFDYKARQTAHFYDALISEITIPACDGTSKDPAYLNVKFAPEFIQWSDGKGAKTVPNSKKQKLWHSANFRLDIPGLDCTRVSKIDGFTIKQKFIEESLGAMRDAIKVPGKIEYPNLRITLPAASAQSWVDWSEDFLVNENNSDDREKDGALTFLTPDLTEELVRVSFHHLGVARIHRSFANANNVPTVTFELYVEGMQIDFMAQFEK